MNLQTTSGPEILVSGRRFALAVLAAVAAAAVAGAVAWFGLKSLALGSALQQIVVFAVYAALVAVFCLVFRPAASPPLALRFSGLRDAAFAIAAAIALIAACALLYAASGPFFGGFRHLLVQLTAIATDAKRLQGQGRLAWTLAIARGCLLVPVFEELFFRGLLLTWLNRHMRFLPALVVMSAVFAAMHVYPVALPYAFLFGLASGYVRRATGSTLNAVLMHILNNVVLLAVGLHFYR